jgi:type IV pilus assembly protein PilC
MAMLSPTASGGTFKSKSSGKAKPTFWESQRLAKQKAYEKQAKKKKIKLEQVTMFTQQLASMLEAGLPLVTTLDALMDQCEDPVFRIVIRDVRNDISSGSSFSEAVRKFPNAFPNLFSSMVEAGEASGALSTIMGKVASYFESSLKLQKKVKSAMTYPIAVICLAIVLVNVLLIFVIPVFAEMFNDFDAELPKPTQLLIDTSDFLQGNIIYLIGGAIVLWLILKKVLKTPGGREAKDAVFRTLPIMGNLTRKINVSRFCRTYAILLKSGVPILKSLEICSRASGNTYIERACSAITRHVSQGGQLSDVIAETPYFPSIVKHMARAGEQTGNVDGMMEKISDFYDNEVDNIVSSLTSLMEPILICVLGVIVGGIVMAMFLPIFQLSSVAGGP